MENLRQWQWQGKERKEAWPRVKSKSIAPILSEKSLFLSDYNFYSSYLSYFLQTSELCLTLVDFEEMKKIFETAHLLLKFFKMKRNNRIVAITKK